MVGIGKEAEGLLPALRRYIADHAEDYAVADDGHGEAELRLEAVSETFKPVAFDAEGVANTYRLTLTGRISIWRDGGYIWRSGLFSVHEDVFAVGGPASIEASRARMSRDLRRLWVSEAWLKLSSGF
jgi:hypothetical protein